MASEDHTVYGEEDLDEDDEEDDDDMEDDDDDDDTSSSNIAAGELHPSSGVVTIAVPGIAKGAQSTSTHGFTGSIHDPTRQRIGDASISASVVEERKPVAFLDDSRRLFQRLWTDEDEIELLQGFLDYTTQRGLGTNSSHHHHDTAVFYDQIKTKLQLDFNKNQLVEKLRRLKKKYRNVLNKINSGKDFVFKSPHDQATFDICRKIWNTDSGGGGMEDEESNPNPSPNPNLVSFDQNNNSVNTHSSGKKTTRPIKRSRAVKIEEKRELYQPPLQNSTPIATSIPNLIEDTVRSCLSPLFKELLHNATNGPGGSRGFGGVAAALSPMPLSFGALNFSVGGDIMTDERWRKQQILELEVYSKRLELVQDQIKSTLEELRSVGS